MEKIMTRWNLLQDITISKEMREAIGKAWPFFFYLVFHINQSNKLITNYAEIRKTLTESQSTIQKWKECLVEHKVINSINGKLSMTLSLLPPYDSLVTCEQDDTAQLRMSSDPATKRIIEKLTVYGNMSLLPIVAELSAKIDILEKKLV
jgi:hypothetical protein